MEETVNTSSNQINSDNGAKKAGFDDKRRSSQTPRINPGQRTASMVKWTKRSAFLLGVCAFGVTFLVSFHFENYLDIGMILSCTIKGMIAGIMFWLTGLVLGNIFLKGLVADVPVDPSNLVEGGILQRLYLYQKRLDPYLTDDNANVIELEVIIDPKKDGVKKDADKNPAGAVGDLQNAKKV